MPIDPNIALQIKPVELPNALAQYAQVQQIQGAQNQNSLAALSFAERQRESDQMNALNDAYKGSVGADGQINRAKLYGSVATGGLGSKIPGIQKSFLETDKLQADVGHLSAQTGNLTAKTATEDFDLRDKKRTKAIVDIAALTSPEHALSSLADHERLGDLTPESAAAVRATIPQNPADFPKWQVGMLQRIMSAKDSAAQIAPDAGQVLAAKTSVENTASNNATTQRGQNMTASTAAASLAAPAYDSERGVLVDKRGGTARPVLSVDGKPMVNVKPLTEFQGKSAAFGDRATKADAILNQIGMDYSPAAISSKQSVESVPLIGGMMGAATNKFALSAKDQQAEQAQRDFINAVLRQESGAVIGPSEFENARKQYFPVPGDKPENIAQKAANRRTTIEGLVRNAGPSAGIGQTAAAPTAATKPSVSNAAEYARIPSGAEYTTPDGHTRRKP